MKTEMRGTLCKTFEWNDYDVEYYARVYGTYYYTPGRMYMPNGDPGYPDEEDTEGPFLDDIEEVTVYDSDGNVNTQVYQEHQAEIDKAISDDIDEAEWYDCEWDEPDDPYDCEPDDEPWEDED